MFVWPEEITSKFVSAHSDPTDDFVDRLNYVYTVGLFMFLATLTGAKQHFGTAIQCMAPTHFPGTWVEYVQDYCFVSNTYMVNTSRIIVKGEAMNVLKEEIWVPYVLLLQALLCYLPKFLWNIIIATRDLDMRCVLEEAMELPSITTLSVRRKHLRRVANLAVGYIKYKQMRQTAECCSTYHFYAVVKWFYFTSCLCQVLLINNFVGDGCLLWGYRFMEEMLKGNDWKTSGIFPRVTFCDVKIAQIGQLNTHTMQCFLMINALNEKLYLVLWFWLLSLVLIDAVSAINSTLLLLCPYLHYTRVLSLLQASDTYIDANDKRSLLNFTENVLRPDGILLLSFIKDRVNGLIASDLTREIWFIMNRCKRLVH
ncbi:innexin family protein [Loa loa]|uniref:Innexin n=1 Tax=Loa loa TaxID=7209 RepID=A0A1S0TVV2_LOALO|nr:innexin family protein [Loa loa]EFO20724.2 innexin family protein [Loa loa]